MNLHVHSNSAVMEWWIASSGSQDESFATNIYQIQKEPFCMAMIMFFFGMAVNKACSSSIRMNDNTNHNATNVQAHTLHPDPFPSAMSCYVHCFEYHWRCSCNIGKSDTHMDASKNRGGPPKWMVKIMENPIKIDDLGVPLFLETPI